MEQDHTVLLLDVGTCQPCDFIFVQGLLPYKVAVVKVCSGQQCCLAGFFQGIASSLVAERIVHNIMYICTCVMLRNVDSV